MGQAKIKQRAAFTENQIVDWEADDCVNFAVALARVTGWLLHVDWWVPSTDPDIVPLAKQAVAILRGIEPVTGHGHFVFPSLRTGERPMSENTINAALRGMGYAKETHSAHGFRAMACTIMDEVQGERVDLIEHQLAHAVKDPNGRAYNLVEPAAARTTPFGSLSGG